MQISRGIGVSKGNFLKESMKKLEFLERLREGGRNQKKIHMKGMGILERPSSVCYVLF